jgi:sigma-E factor negative regulatory protein RseB
MGAGVGGTVVLLVAVAVLCLLVSGSAQAVVPGDPAETDNATDLLPPRAANRTVPVDLPQHLRLFLAEERQADGTLEATSEVMWPEGDGYVHLGYSDGSSVVSVFIQKGRLDIERLGNWHAQQRDGHTIWVQGSDGKNAIWSSGGYVYTVFADAPAEMAGAAIAALPHEAEPGLVERLTRGLDRVLAWTNPFD